MFSQSHSLSLIPNLLSLSANSSPSLRCSLAFPFSSPPPNLALDSPRTKLISTMTSNSRLSSCTATADLGFEHCDLDRFVHVANELADAAGEVIRGYFRRRFEILEKDDLSPVTIADQAAEESMVSIILENFPSHAIYGEEKGWRSEEKSTDFVWVLDPIDGTKSFITGKPLFGTLIALLHKGKPILGIIDQPVLRERWIGISGRKTTLNGQEVSTRTCAKLSEAYLYTTSPHLFSGNAEEAFARVRSKVKVPLYGCDCYAYALLASGFVDLVIESGLKPYDFLSLIPVIEGAGGVITDWKGRQLYWEASSDSRPTSMTHEVCFIGFFPSFQLFVSHELLDRNQTEEPTLFYLLHYANHLMCHIRLITGFLYMWVALHLWVAFEGFNVVAAGDEQLHQQAVDSLQWP